MINPFTSFFQDLYHNEILTAIIFHYCYHLSFTTSCQCDSTSTCLEPNSEITPSVVEGDTDIRICLSSNDENIQDISFLQITQIDSSSGETIDTIVDLDTLSFVSEDPTSKVIILSADEFLPTAGTVTLFGEVSLSESEQSFQLGLDVSASQASTVTYTGSFDVVNLDTSLFNDNQMAEVMGYFEDAITQELSDVLPPGSYDVTVTSIDNGIVQYEIVTDSNSNAETIATANSIETTLSQVSTLASITNAVITSSQASTDIVIQNSITSSTSVISHTFGGSTTTATASSELYNEFPGMNLSTTKEVGGK